MTQFKEPIGIHNELNPVLWDSNKNLHPDVELALLRIAKEFYKFLDVNAKIVDIVVSGSQANYNYSTYSDLDLHLIIPISDIECDEPIEELFDTKRKLWKERHNIEIHDIPVELYAEDQAKPAVSSSYSIIKREWINSPDAPIISYNVSAVRRKATLWSKVIVAAIRSRDLKKCETVFDLLMKYRKAGLAADGEFGVPNLTFKSLRNSGLIEKLHDTINSLKDQDLSLE